jgi:hypothetical protein
MQSSGFLQKCLGISLIAGTILFGSAALIASVQPAKADNIALNDNKGKIMMEQNSFVINGNFNYTLLVWDTETGKSKLYTYINDTWTTNIGQLPVSPIY